MEMPLLFDILKWLVPVIIALCSLIYAYKQRQIVKEEISKKRYLENAQVNLNEVIKILRDIHMPKVSSLTEEFESLSDLYHEYRENVPSINALELLKASFELRTKKITLNVTYVIHDHSEVDRAGKEKHVTKEISDFSSFSVDWFIKFFHTHHPPIYSKVEIPNYEHKWWNDFDFYFLTTGLQDLDDAKRKLLVYEEVYEKFSPDSISKLNDLFEEIAKEIFMFIRTPKKIEINLDDFSTVDEIMEHLFEKLVNYSCIMSKFSKVSEIISELTKVRKELFLKIS